MNNSNNNVAIYCRVSTQMQSTDRQEEELLKYAEQKGFKITPNHIYKDVISGFSIAETRPEYDRLFACIKSGEIKKVLFWELTRLGRNSVELLKEIEKLKELDVELYFKSQNLTINSKQDLGSRILLAVLAVTATYEIELFAERSVSGKINKILMGGGVGGDNNAYGYCNDRNKKMIIKDSEAKIIKRIFTEYASGKSTIKICDGLNADKIPTSYATRTKEFRTRRNEKGLKEKEYKNFNPDTLIWKPNMISKILCKELYTGKRHVVFHKPKLMRQNSDVTEKKEHEIIFEYNKQCEDLRIISDEVFTLVQQRLSEAKYNKNNAIKHENLLKDKIICGECGANFSVGNSMSNATSYVNGERTYKCYGRINRSDKPATCTNGSSIRQWRLDGLILTLSLKMFAEINLEENNNKRIDTLEIENVQARKIILQKEDILKKVKEDYKLAMKNYSKVNNEIVESLIVEATNKYEKESADLQLSIEKQRKLITTNNITIQQLKNFNQGLNINIKMDQIRNDKGLVKSMIAEYIKKIYVYRINKLWNLIVVRYTNDVEFWGTIKAARYKQEEMFYDETLCKYGIEFHTWIINNSEKCFEYDKENHLFVYNGNSSIYTDLNKGIYTYEEFNEMLYKAGWIGSYSLFDYEFGSTNIKVEKEKLTDNENMYVDWNSHNEKVLRKLKSRTRNE